LLRQRLDTAQRAFGEQVRALGLGVVRTSDRDLGLGLHDTLLQLGVVDTRNDGVRGHDVADVDRQLFEAPTHLRGHDELLRGLEGAAEGAAEDELAAPQLDRLDRGRGTAGAAGARGGIAGPTSARDEGERPGHPAPQGLGRRAPVTGTGGTGGFDGGRPHSWTITRSFGIPAAPG
jgi:hypothetical protein